MAGQSVRDMLRSASPCALVSCLMLRMLAMLFKPSCEPRIGDQGTTIFSMRQGKTADVRPAAFLVMLDFDMDALCSC